VFFHYHAPKGRRDGGQVYAHLSVGPQTVHRAHVHSAPGSQPAILTAHPVGNKRTPSIFRIGRKMGICAAPRCCGFVVRLLRSSRFPHTRYAAEYGPHAGSAGIYDYRLPLNNARQSHPHAGQDARAMLDMLPLLGRLQAP